MGSKEVIINMDDKNKNAIEVYDLIAEDYARKFDPIESDDDLVFPNSFLSHLKLGSKIVDLGCGTGFSAGYFVKNGMNVVGVDLSKSMIGIAQKNYPSIHFFIDDIRKFSLNDQVDAVWAGYSLFHFEQEHFEATLDKIKTYLKPDGIFGLVMQEGDSEIERDEPFLPGKKIYLHLYTENELIEILEKHGFKVIERKLKKAESFEFPYDKILLVAKFINN